MPVSKDEFRRSLGNLASGVTVVSLRQRDDALGGITVTAFSSLSLEPPLVLICIDRRARLHDELELGRAFAVNFLAADQEHLSQRFATRHAAPFEDLSYSLGRLGSPLLSGAVASIECKVVDILPGGDHSIIIGSVEQSTVDDHASVASDASGQKNPLLYFRGRYARLA